MNKCKTCKWWTRTPPATLYFEQANAHIPEYEHARQYIREHGVAVHGDCACPKFAYGNIPQSADGLSYQDAEHYAATFVTGEDFGCVHHEPKG